MKLKLLLFGILTCYCLTSFCQGFVSEDNQWNVRLTSFGSSTEIFVVQGDSVYNSIIYKKIWMTYDSTLSGMMYQGLVREYDSVVYYVPHNGTEGLLYDFNLEVGENAFIKNVFCGELELEVVVVGIDTVEFFGVERKRWHLESEGWTEYWLEGIGSLSGPLYSFYPLCIICPVWDLLCFHENEDLLYIMPGQTTCYQTSVGIDDVRNGTGVIVSPNPVSHGEQYKIYANRPIKSVNIFNSVGLPVNQFDFTPDQQIVLETRQMKPGLYMIIIETTVGNSITKKLIIQ